jgi:signal transduction histidine kinase
MRVVRRGAQDYLVKGRIDGDQLVRSMRYAIERQHAEEVRRHLALAQPAVRRRDEFLTIAAHELRTPVTVVHGSGACASQPIVAGARTCGAVHWRRPPIARRIQGGGGVTSLSQA